VSPVAEPTCAYEPTGITPVGEANPHAVPPPGGFSKPPSARPSIGPECWHGTAASFLHCRTCNPNGYGLICDESCEDRQPAARGDEAMRDA
jgi:hypothetical protein